MTSVSIGPIAILGAGNVGQALARGLLASRRITASGLALTMFGLVRE